MTRRNRTRISDDEDDSEHLPPRRTRGVVASYNEDDDESDGSNSLPKDDEVKPNDDDDDYDDHVASSRRSRNRKARSKIDSDDEFYEDDNVSDDDEFLQKLEEKNFIATDDDDSNNDYSFDSRPKKRRRRDRSKSAEPAIDLNNETEEEDIQQEIADLYDSSPTASPVKHKLRDRQTKIDYTIPPPITNDTQINQSPSYKGRGRKPNSNKFEYRKLLYPTAGPFGGSDVLSLFGTNIPPGGIPIPGLTDTTNMTAIGQNVSDSDSSDDEIVAINETKVSSSTAKNKPNFTQIISAGSANPKDKQKNTLSDTDPLGVDMNIDFSVVGGLDNYINQLKEMVALPLLYPELYQNFDITPPRGVLFHGPPGTGKTLMARALAASCSTAERKITFYMRKGADCLSKWVGEAERQLRLLFEEAKKNQPSIIFFDEIDGLAPVRSSKQEQIHASIVSTLLALMDGMDNRGQVIVIGATNRPDSIDPALRRPGRFDREFYFPLPDINARKDILKIQTRKWTPPLQDAFIEKLAELTKGYGGADLRALCTEAALNSIQRKYPQIYKSNDKLQVNPSKIKVIAKDFMRAMDSIVPSSARSTSTGSAPLPEHLSCLLKNSLDEVTSKLNSLLPNAVGIAGKKKPTALDEAMYLDPTVKDADGGFAKQQLLKNLQDSRVCKPHLLICGNEGNGQQYISSAVLNYLEGFQVQSLDMGNIFGDYTRTPELTIVQAFIEARRHQPSILFIPNIDIWFRVIPYAAKATLTSLLRNLKSSEQVLLLGVSETNSENLDPEIKSIFGFNSSMNNISLGNPSREGRKEFFSSLNRALHMKPHEFINDLEKRPKRKLKQLKVFKDNKKTSDEALDKKKKKMREYEDTKLKNVLKIKLAVLMDLFKTRYKRFKKPIIDENLLYHLFDPSVLNTPFPQYEVLYEKSDDKEHENMIREISTGKYYYNMDLDVIEERLWNGYYSEPKQFLKDIKLIVKDAMTSGDRDRILKANEMLTNAQFGIDDFATPEFLKACRELREREAKRQEELLKEHKKLLAQFEQHQKLQEQQKPELPPQALTNSVLQPAIDLNGSETAAVVTTLQQESEDINKPVEIANQDINQPVEIANQDINKPVEISNQNGTITETEPVPMEITKTETVSNGKVPHEEPEATNETSDESEVEPNDGVDMDRELNVDEAKVDELFQHTILDCTNGCNIEKLEIIMAKLMDIVWRDRDEWDKSRTIEKLTTELTMFKASFNLAS